MDAMLMAMVFNWYIMIVMFVGYRFIKECERFLQLPYNEDDIDYDKARLGAERIIQEYNSRSFAGRVVYVIMFGNKLLFQRRW